jgi:hypothetical protein
VGPNCLTELDGGFQERARENRLMCAAAQGRRLPNVPPVLARQSSLQEVEGIAMERFQAAQGVTVIAPVEGEGIDLPAGIEDEDLQRRSGPKVSAAPCVPMREERQACEQRAVRRLHLHR